MKTRFFRRVALTFLLSTLNLQPPTLFAQGSLTPPGAPAPTMKSLDQVEARTAIDPRQAGFTLPYTISTPGSYYLAANVTATGSTAGIIVNASNVTIDLNGFALVGGGGGSVAGINVPNTQLRSSICVRNGTISGWGGPGVMADFSENTLFEKLRLSNNGGAGGLSVSSGVCLVVGCTSAENRTVGFLLGNVSTIVNCGAVGNTGAGIQVAANCSVLHCTAGGNDVGAGIQTSFGCMVSDCTAGSNATVGISVDSGSAVRGCTTSHNFGNGIVSTNNCLLSGNVCDSNNVNQSNTNAGIFTAGNGNTIDSNSCTANGNGGGIISTGSHNIIIRNSCSGNGFNYNIPGTNSSNTFGPVVDSSAGGVITNTNPWANWIH